MDAANVLLCKFHIYLQNDSNLRQPPKYNTSAKEKCIYPNLRQPPKNKTYAKKKYCTISYTYCIKHVRFYLPIPVIVTVSIFTVSAFIFLTLLTFPSSALTFHNILPSVPSTVLYI